MKVNISRQLRTEKPAAGTGYCPVLITVTWNGLRKRLAPGLVVHPDHWDSARQRVKSLKGVPYSAEINAKLSEWEQAIIDAAPTADSPAALEAAVLEQMKPEKAQQLKVRQQARETPRNLAAPIAKPTDFAGLWAEWIQSCRSRVSNTGELVADKSLQQYAVTGKRLREWAHAVDVPLTLAKVCTTGFYESFREWALRNRELAPNTFGKFIKHLKHFLGWCESQDDPARWPPSPKWRQFEAPNRYVGVDTLDIEEVQSLQALDFQSAPVREVVSAGFAAMKPAPGTLVKRGQRRSQVDDHRINERLRVLELARDIFLMCCYTGLRISDVQTMTLAMIRGKVIRIEATKNRIECVIPYFDDDLFRPGELVHKYAGKAPVGRVFPDLHNINDYLHQVGELAGITRLPLTTKFGRKTFVTLSVYKDVPVRVIMQATGHQTEKSFNRYLGVNINELVKAFQKRARKLPAAA